MRTFNHNFQMVSLWFAI